MKKKDKNKAYVNYKEMFAIISVQSCFGKACFGLFKILV